MRILLTGASRGIGRAVAEKLAKPGISLALCASVSSGDHDDAVETCKKLGAQVTGLTGDLGDRDVPNELVREAVAAFGGLEAVISNAGIVKSGSLAEIDPEDWDRIFAVNVRSAWLLSRAAHPHLAVTRGSYVAVASMSGVEPYPGAGAYSASKAALIMLVRQIAQEWAASGVRANAVSPGLFHSAMTAPLYTDPAIKAAREALIPMHRIGEPAQDIAGLVEFLISTQTGYLTGQNIVVDGGLLGSIQAHIAGRPKSRDA